MLVDRGEYCKEPTTTVVPFTVASNFEGFSEGLSISVPSKKEGDPLTTLHNKLPSRIKVLAVLKKRPEDPALMQKYSVLMHDQTIYLVETIIA
jgi:hypothetical protein